MKLPTLTSNRSKRKIVREIDINSFDLNKRIHKRSKRRNKVIAALKLKHIGRSGAKDFQFTDPGGNKYH